MFWVYTAAALVAWYAVAYFGLREVQRRDRANRYEESSLSYFGLWVISPIPPFALLVTYGAAIRAGRNVPAVLGPVAAWLFPNTESEK